ncbi:MAG: L,D-transpeptidase family protein [Patescibacteria group bacterium]
MRFQTRYLLAIAAVSFGLAVQCHPARAEAKKEFQRSADVTLWSSDFHGRLTVTAFEKSFLNGGFLAAGDLDGDKVDEIIVGSGPGRVSEVKIYSSDGLPWGSFRPYPTAFQGGVRVAAGDMDGDGKAEIVTAPGAGMEPRLKIFDSQGNEKIKGGALAYATHLQNGVRLAVGDIDGDGKPEVLTAPGPGGRAHIRAFDSNLVAKDFSFFAFDGGMTDGTSLAFLKSPSGTRLAVAPEFWTTSTVRLFDPKDLRAPAFEFQPFADVSSTRLGLTLAAFDMNSDGTDEIVAARNGQSSPEIRISDWSGSEKGRYLVVDPNYRGALSFIAAKTNGPSLELAVMPTAPTIIGPLDREKSIEVNLTQQRLYAWEHGRLARTFLVSTGVKKYPTPVMETKVLMKIPMMDYRGYYGPNNPDNYFLKNVKNNLRIRGSILIHYAYWHHNFGHRMSHGCINVGNKDSDWIFAWAEVGTPVSVHY